MNRSHIRATISKLLTTLFLVMTLITAELGMVTAPVLAASQLQTALTVHSPLATVSRQSMAATQNRAGNFAKTKEELDQELTNTVTDATADIKAVTKGAIKTVQRKANTDTKAMGDAANKAELRAQKDINRVQDSAEELGEAIQDKAEETIDFLQ